jgi:heme exporter protein B
MITTITHASSLWIRQALVVFGKDVAIERSTGEIVATSGFFAVLVTVLASLAFSTTGYGPRAFSGVVWLAVAFSAVLATSRSWQREREESALVGLVLSPIARSAIYVGKAAGTLVFVAAIELIVLPCSALLLGVDLVVHLGPLLTIALLADVGIAAVGTLFGAMTVRTKARDLVLASVVLPLLAPTLGSAIAATRELLDGARLVELGDYLELMLVFDVVFGAAGVWLFGVLVEE